MMKYCPPILYKHNDKPAPHDPADSSTFHNLFRCYGGREDYPELSEGNFLDGSWLSSLRKDTWIASFEWYRRRHWGVLSQLSFLGSPLDSTYLDIVCNRHLDGCAASCGDRDYIGVFAGTYVNLMRLFLTLMSHPRILPEIGDPGLESEWFSSFGNCDWMKPLDKRFASRFGRATHDPLRGLVVQDPVRLSAANVLAVIASEFLFFHEIGHVAHGHTRYLRDVAGISHMAEACDTPGIPPEERQALELQADAFACACLPNSVSSFRITDKEPDNCFETDLEGWTAGIFAVGVLFLVLDRRQSSVAAYDSANHPHPAMRFLLVHDHSLRNAPTAIPAAWAAAEESLNVASELFGCQPAVPFAINNEHEHICQRASTLANLVNEMKERLKAYSALQA